MAKKNSIAIEVDMTIVCNSCRQEIKELVEQKQEKYVVVNEVTYDGCYSETVLRFHTKCFNELMNSVEQR